MPCHNYCGQLSVCTPVYQLSSSHNYRHTTRPHALMQSVCCLPVLATVLINRDYVMILTDHRAALPNMQYEMYVLIQLSVNKHAAFGATAWLQTELLVSGSKQWFLCWYYVWPVKWICVRFYMFVADCTSGGWHRLFCLVFVICFIVLRTLLTGILLHVFQYIIVCFDFRVYN